MILNYFRLFRGILSVVSKVWSVTQSHRQIAFALPKAQKCRVLFGAYSSAWAFWLILELCYLRCAAPEDFAF